MGNSIVGARIESRRKEIGLTLDDIAQEIGVAKSTIQRYEKGTIETLKLPVIEAIARVLRVNPAWVVGKSNDMEENVLIDGLYPLPRMNQVPLVGNIACGTPILAEDNIEEYVDLPEHIRADFALRCKGDSMINAGIRDGDIVYIRKQKQVNNGQIAAVRVGDDEATLKRFYYEDGVVQLVPENSSMSPKAFTGEAINQLEIIGLAVGYTHALEQ